MDTVQYHYALSAMLYGERCLSDTKQNSTRFPPFVMDFSHRQTLSIKGTITSTTISFRHTCTPKHKRRIEHNFRFQKQTNHHKIVSAFSNSYLTLCVSSLIVSSPLLFILFHLIMSWNTGPND